MQTYNIDGLMKERRYHSTLAMELRLSYTNPSICCDHLKKWAKYMVSQIFIEINSGGLIHPRKLPTKCRIAYFLFDACL